jgi:hypothetical protein
VRLVAGVPGEQPEFLATLRVKTEISSNATKHDADKKFCTDIFVGLPVHIPRRAVDAGG